MYKLYYGDVILYFKNRRTLIDFLDDNIPDFDDPRRLIKIEVV